MTIHESDSCREIVHQLRIYLSSSLISAQLQRSAHWSSHQNDMPNSSPPKIKLLFNTVVLPENNAGFHMGWV